MNITSFSMPYIALYDLESADFFTKLKKPLENSDPSVYYASGTGNATGSSVMNSINAQDGTKTNNVTTAQPIVINKFLGFLGSLSTSLLDLNDTDDLYIEIRWCQPTVCLGSANTGTVIYSTLWNLLFKQYSLNFC